MLILICLAAINLNCQTSVAHQTDEQMIDFFNQNEQDFSRLAKMAGEDQKLWRIKLGNLLTANVFEIYSENDFRPATEADVTIERQNEYLGLMKKTGVCTLIKENYLAKSNEYIFVKN